MDGLNTAIGLTIYAIFVSSIRQVATRGLIDPMQHDLQVVNSKTFTQNVHLARQTNVVGALFYSPSDSNAVLTVEELNAASKELKGMINIVAVNCGDVKLRNLCSSELGEDYTTPTFKVYPKLPVPAFNFQKKLNKEEVKKELLKHLPSAVDRVEPGMLAHFMSKHDVMPKVLLFSDKENPSYVYKALSNAFHNKLLLGFVDVNKNQELKKQYKVSKVPAMIVVRPNQKVLRYKGEFKYLPMFEWLNVSSEAFLLGGGYSDKTSAKAKPWKFEKLPKLNLASHHDICFNKSHGLCIIYLTKEDLKDDEKKMLTDLSEKYKGQLTGKWMWMNVAEEKEYGELFKTVEAFPSAVVFNPKGRVRYFLHDGTKAVTKYSMERMLEKILGGDARFTHVTGQVPNFRREEEILSEEL